VLQEVKEIFYNRFIMLGTDAAGSVTSSEVAREKPTLAIPIIGMTS